MEGMGHDQHAPNISFAAALMRSTSAMPQDTIQPKPTLYKGEPAVFLTDEEIELMSIPLKKALVGKISQGRPTLDILRKEFHTIGFKGEFTIGAIDGRHVLIRFVLEEDYHRCWIKGHWNFGKYYMRIMKWSPDFSVDSEPPIAPVWIGLHGLPFHMFNKEMLFAIGSSIGKTLKIDTPTFNFTRPSVARICVEIDLMKPVPKRIRLGKETNFIMQPISYENLPAYCMVCHKLGHEETQCRQGKAPIHSQVQKQMELHVEKKVENQVWKAKATSSGSGITNMEKQEIPTLINKTPQETAMVDLLAKGASGKVALVETLKEPNNSVLLEKVCEKPKSFSESSKTTMTEPQRSSEDPNVIDAPQPPTNIDLQETSATGNLIDSQPLLSATIEVIPLQQQVQVENRSSSESLQEKIQDNNHSKSAVSPILPSEVKKSVCNRMLSDEELLARMPDQPWKTFIRVAHSTEKKQTFNAGNLLQEPQQMLSFKLPEISSDNELPQTEESREDHDIPIQVVPFDQDDFIPVISKKQKARNKKDNSTSVKTMHTRQDSRRSASSSNS